MWAAVVDRVHRVTVCEQTERVAAEADDESSCSSKLGERCRSNEPVDLGRCHVSSLGKGAGARACIHDTAKTRTSSNLRSSVADIGVDHRRGCRAERRSLRPLSGSTRPRVSSPRAGRPGISAVTAGRLSAGSPSSRPARPRASRWPRSNRRSRRFRGSRADAEGLGPAVALLAEGRRPADSSSAGIAERLTTCIGCGCLSIDRCTLLNPEDEAVRLGGGAHYLLKDGPRSRSALP